MHQAEEQRAQCLRQRPQDGRGNEGKSFHVHTNALGVMRGAWRIPLVAKTQSLQRLDEARNPVP